MRVGNDRLGSLLRAVKDETGLPLGDLTVLSPQLDPYRLDTPANHECARWFRDQMEACGLLRRGSPIHNRGVHYAVVARGQVRLPSGKSYKNDAECWEFLERASKAARWLGYVQFQRIVDARNPEPIIQIAKHPDPHWGISVGASLELPEVDELNPTVHAYGFEASQHYHLVFFGEKTSLGTVLQPLAEDYGADLYLPSGEISDTLLALMARNGEEDGRPMVVLVFADCDPAGYQMAVSIGHKLRALEESLYPSLTFVLHAVALTVEQVKDLDLPSTPLKETEQRAAGWRERYGIEQTEIDALATLDPVALQQIVREACNPYFDDKLATRMRKAREAWEARAQAALDDKASLVDDIRERAEASVEEVREKLSALEVAVDDLDLDLPPFELPTPEPPLDGPEPLISSDMPLLEAIQILRARKRYTNGEGAP